MKNQYRVAGTCLAIALLAACRGSVTNPPLFNSVPAPSRTVHSHPLQGTYELLHSFGNGTDGRMPAASLINVNGSLYGTTENGGAYNDGTVFSVATSGTEKVLHSFGSSTDGAGPAASLINANGTLYGTTENGGAHQGGTVFSITTSGTEKVLYSFSTSFPGSGPAASLINVNGTLYGMTFGIGAYRYGTVFTISTKGAEKVLHSFGHGSDGKYPSGGLTDLDNSLYGTTQEGGTYNEGIVFKISTSGTEKVLHSFGSSSDGQDPSTGLAAVGNTLYGTTPFGGAANGTPSNGGAVFSITSSGTEKVLYSFCCSNGTQPYGSLLNVKGTLYGTTGNGGTTNANQCPSPSAYGTVFSLTTSGTETLLHTFLNGSSDGGNPDAALVDVNGTLYGTTESGGAYGGGTVFSITTTGNAKIRRHKGAKQELHPISIPSVRPGDNAAI